MCSSSLEVQVVRWAHGQCAGRTYHFEGRCPLDEYTPSGQAFTSPALTRSAKGLRADRDVRVGSVPRQLGLRRLGCRGTDPTCTTRSEGSPCAPCERTTSSEGVPGRVYPVKVKVSSLVVAGSACSTQQVVQPLPAHWRRRRRARSTRRTDYVQAYAFSCEVGVRSTVSFVPHVFAAGSGLCQSSFS